MSRWPGEAEAFRRLALSHVQAAREFADKARQSTGTDRREAVADCRRNITEARLNMRDAKETPTTHQDRWSPGAMAHVQLADGHLLQMWHKVRRVDEADDALGNALLAEIAAWCGDVTWYLREA